ncbi:3-isopropylmalate dehydratase small subunit [Roseisalinus antarcticus]|uniref:3-isopropylmalate dehydratase small subunit n=1 Tax=Roseisalinus antarcticus TaxID=254357 RepID=A0A1Y5RYM8_9RHOB|nr:3-isopropylmalate dehydratase small subunit [Roseisalinus antarcticus]SLN25569.1 3-isopropylmalate dehydratase small subunit [Roseisalinus antarcticus]
MDRFETLVSRAAPLLEDNIDTDVIFPARFLLLLDRDGLGRHAFSERRKADGSFVLDRPDYAGAQILVTGQNFGTGSSREQAVWTLADLGIRCVIAPSFGEIFHANCFKNGVLPITLPEPDMVRVRAAAAALETVTVDLDAQQVVLAEGAPIPFDVSAYRKRLLLLGLDEVGLILTDDLAAIETFEAARAQTAPWLSIAADRFDLSDTARDPQDAD